MDLDDVEDHRVRHPGFDGRVREYTREGFREDVEMLSVDERTTQKYGSIEGNGPTEVQHARTLAQIPEDEAWSVMVALADYLGYEVTAK